MLVTVGVGVWDGVLVAVGELVGVKVTVEVAVVVGVGLAVGVAVAVGVGVLVGTEQTLGAPVQVHPESTEQELEQPSLMAAPDDVYLETVNSVGEVDSRALNPNTAPSLRTINMESEWLPT